MDKKFLTNNMNDDILLKLSARQLKNIDNWTVKQPWKFFNEF